MLASFSVIPVGVGEALSEHVAKIIDAVDKSGLDYRLGAMQTTVEGDAESVMALIMDCHRLMRGASKRVLTSITIDDREGAEGRLTGKVSDIEKILGRSVGTE